MPDKRKIPKILKKFFAIMLFVFLIPHGYYMIVFKEDIVKKEEPLYCGIGAYVINLDRSPERYDFVKSSIQSLGYPVERISAVDGKLLSEEERNQKVDLKTMGFWNNSPGAIGCALSHLKTWETFLNSNYEYALIFEDDVSFSPDDVKNAVDLATKMKNWDMCMFGISYDEKPTWMDLKIKDINRQTAFYALLKKRVTTSCYLINRKAAKRYIAGFFPIRMPVDIYYFRSWEFDINIMGVLPIIVKQNFGDSQITCDKNKLPFLDKMQRIYFSQKANLMIFIFGLKNWFLKH